ncbi:hypothetical protein [Brevundimonas subvibrioides]|uniref:hypothetical protein n=1 Tax=Brevundimonas subvibrioides TaxID=74313 RepID=UPI00059EF292|nr:hypothetical protein [Brevundimonas subvibrioides]
MNALLTSDEVHKVQTQRVPAAARETSRFVQVDPVPDATVDTATLPVDHFRFGTWIGEQLTAVRHLPENWDGYGAPKIAWPVIRAMSRSLAGLQPARAFRAGAIVPGADGSLQIEWHLATVSIEFCIDHDLAETFWMKDRVTGAVVLVEGAAAQEAFRASMGALRC